MSREKPRRADRRIRLEMSPWPPSLTRPLISDSTRATGQPSLCRASRRLALFFAPFNRSRVPTPCLESIASRAVHTRTNDRKRRVPWISSSVCVSTKCVSPLQAHEFFCKYLRNRSIPCAFLQKREAELERIFLEYFDL